MDEDEVDRGFLVGGGRDGYVSFGRRDTNTFRREMVESKKLGTSADSNLRGVHEEGRIVSRRLRTRRVSPLDSHDGDA